MYKMQQIIIVIFAIFLIPGLLRAEKDKKHGMPPAKVVVSEVSSGKVAEEMEFVGTVFFQEVSDVASEVSGLVEAVEFEEGKRLKKGDMLVKLSSDLLIKTLNATEANYEQVLSDLEQAKLTLRRSKKLFEDQLISEESYDEKRFNVNGLEKKALALNAEVERLEVEMEKKTIRAPFDCLVIGKHVDRGEWLSTGSILATVANDTLVDILVEVPEKVVTVISPGMSVKVNTGGSRIEGTVFSIVPKGDISTRTFPVKVRAKNTISLIEGMEARINLPINHEKRSLTVHRDAVITAFGNTVVYTVTEGKAEMVPVTVTGYKGMIAGIQAEGLKAGMKVVIKGNERLRPGQDVIVTE